MSMSSSSGGIMRMVSSQGTSTERAWLLQSSSRTSCACEQRRTLLS